MKKIIKVFILQFIFYPLLGQINTDDVVMVNCGNLSRDKLAEQLHIINKYNPKVVVYNITFINDSAETDKALLKEFSRTKNLILAGRRKTTKNGKDTLITTHKKFLKYGTLGLVNYKYDIDTDIVGFIYLGLTYDNVFINTIHLQAINLFSQEKYNKLVALKTGFYPTYCPNVTYPEFPGVIIPPVAQLNCEDVFEERFTKDALTDKIIVIGYYGPDEDKYKIYNEFTRNRKNYITTNSLYIDAFSIAFLLKMVNESK
jgi:CHASE2 domain-containing sensor protein